MYYLCNFATQIRKNQGKDRFQGKSDVPQMAMLTFQRGSNAETGIFLCTAMNFINSNDYKLS